MTRASNSDFTYDFPASSSKSPLLRTHRSRSPRHRSADVSRLLDPSYSHSTRPTSVYVDEQGNMHDPDYRPFPILVHPPSMSCVIIDQDEDDDEDYLPIPTQGRRHRDSVSTFRSLSSAPYSSPPTTPFVFGSYSPPTSLEEESALDDRRSRCHSPVRKFVESRRASKARQEELERFRASMDIHPLVVDDDDEDEDYEPPLINEKHDEPTPTCTQGLKKEWQAFSLGVRLSVIRARRNVRERVSVLHVPGPSAVA